MMKYYCQQLQPLKVMSMFMVLICFPTYGDNQSLRTARQEHFKQFLRPDQCRGTIVANNPFVEAIRNYTKTTSGDVFNDFSKYRYISLRRLPKSSADNLEKIFERGTHIMAHGTSNLFDLFGMMGEGQICSQFYGSLTDGKGTAGITSGPKGPYYVIIDDQQLLDDLKKSKGSLTSIPGKYHQQYLVPTVEEKQLLETYLDKLKAMDILNQEELITLKNKIITYQMMLTRLAK